MRNKKGLLAIAGAILLVAVVAFVYIRTSGNDEVQATEEDVPKPVNIYSSDLEPDNPTDYSQMKAGDVFYDDFWHGTVTIVGKVGELDCTYNEFIENADGRLIATQDGMNIYVELDETQEPASDMDAVQSGEVEGQNIPEDNAFYASPAVMVDYGSDFPWYSSQEIFPGCGWESLRYAVKQYLIDIGLEDVTTLTVLRNTVCFAENPHGFQCTMDAEDGEIGAYFDMTTGMWMFTSSKVNNGESYMTYNPLDFCVPSTKDRAREELNQLVGYEKF